MSLMKRAGRARPNPWGIIHNPIGGFTVRCSFAARDGGGRTEEDRYMVVKKEWGGQQGAEQALGRLDRSGLSHTNP